MLQNELGLLPRLPSILFKCAVHPDGTPCNTSTAARAQVLGALASVMTVWLVTGILLFEAVQRIINPEPVDGKSECGGLQLPAAPGCMAASTVHWCWAGCCSQAALCGLATKCLWRMAAQLSCATPVMSKAFCVPPPCWPVMFIVAMAGVGCNILMMVRRAGQGRAAATLACRRFCRACQVAWRLCTFEGTANMKLKCPCAFVPPCRLSWATTMATAAPPAHTDMRTSRATRTRTRTASLPALNFVEWDWPTCVASHMLLLGKLLEAALTDRMLSCHWFAGDGSHAHAHGKAAKQGTAVQAAANGAAAAAAVALPAAAVDLEAGEGEAAEHAHGGSCCGHAHRHANGAAEPQGHAHEHDHSSHSRHSSDEEEGEHHHAGDASGRTPILGGAGHKHGSSCEGHDHSGHGHSGHNPSGSSGTLAAGHSHGHGHDHANLNVRGEQWLPHQGCLPGCGTQAASWQECSHACHPLGSSGCYLWAQACWQA